MKGLRLVLPPFAPDMSGASAVFYELGGMIVIIDAGGCAGNVCGFDEPRWFSRRSAIFSAGLRDMDAIFGRDDLLAEKLALAADANTPFIALIGTPVPAVIGTDYRALKRLVERKTGCRTICLETTGIGNYDVGAEEAYLKLFQEFAGETGEKSPGAVGILGATPLDVSKLDIKSDLAAALDLSPDAICCYTMGDGLEAVENAAAVEENLVIAPSGIKAAKYLKEKFGTPYRLHNPLAKNFAHNIKDAIAAARIDGGEILIIHQQVFAASLREEIQKLCGGDLKIRLASFFEMAEELRQGGDVRLKEEDDLRGLAKGGFSLVVADAILKPFFKAAAFIDAPHFGLSGRLEA